MTPGSTRAVRASGSIARMWCRYFDPSTTTATLVVWPARPVPPARETIGAPKARQAATMATTSSVVFGIATPMGTCR